jgi:hypothetical protein
MLEQGPTKGIKSGPPTASPTANQSKNTIEHEIDLAKCNFESQSSEKRLEALKVLTEQANRPGRTSPQGISEVEVLIGGATDNERAVRVQARKGLLTQDYASLRNSQIELEKLLKQPGVDPLFKLRLGRRLSDAIYEPREGVLVAGGGRLKLRIGDRIVKLWEALPCRFRNGVRNALQSTLPGLLLDRFEPASMVSEAKEKGEYVSHSDRRKIANKLHQALKETFKDEASQRFLSRADSNIIFTYATPEGGGAFSPNTQIRLHPAHAHNLKFLIDPKQAISGYDMEKVACALEVTCHEFRHGVVNTQYFKGDYKFASLGNVSSFFSTGMVGRQRNEEGFTAQENSYIIDRALCSTVKALQSGSVRFARNTFAVEVDAYRYGVKNYHAFGATLGIDELPRSSTLREPEDEKSRQSYAKLREEAKKKFMYTRT